VRHEVPCPECPRSAQELPFHEHRKTR
jgi:hypothetical protein